MTNHILVQKSEGANTRSWVCGCGSWATVEYKSGAEGHTPMAERFSGHLAQVEEIESGQAAMGLPAHRLETYHRKSWIRGIPGKIVTRAVWFGGWRDIAMVACGGCWTCDHY